MRILFLTNFYPPYEIGGMGQSCRQVVDSLKQAGHDTLVLTSMHGVQNRQIQEGDVHRWLYLEMDFEPWMQAFKFFLKRKEREEVNLRRFGQLLREKRPDLIFIWGMWNLPRSIAAFAESRYPGRVVYRFADYWPTLPSQYIMYWQKTGRRWFSRIPKVILGAVARALLVSDDRPSLMFEHTMCVSAATRDILVAAGVPVNHSRVIHTGIDSVRFLRKSTVPARNPNNGSLELLYAGRIRPDKGIETAIEAVRRLVVIHGRRSIRLGLAGTGAQDYLKQLQETIMQAGIEDQVHFYGRIPSEEIPGLLHRHQVLLVPSTWEEPFSRAVLEGMAAGLVVIGTRLGGTKEVITHLENGILTEPGDPEDLVSNILKLADEPRLYQSLSAKGLKTVKTKFTIDRMMADIESFLLEVADSAIIDSSDEPATLEVVKA